MSASPALQIDAQDLSVSYDSQVALEIAELNLTGNVIAVVGHNGAGKSTLIKAILGLLPCARGKIDLRYKINGEEVLLSPEEHMAFCPETGAVFADISVESYIQLWCRIKHRDPHYYRHTGSSIIETLEVNSLLTKLGRELSKGERRRVQTAIGFLIRPKLFLFDEPFDGLDVLRAHELANVLERSAREMALVVSSHRMDIVERLADIVIVLSRGRVVAAGSVPKVNKLLCGTSLILSQLKLCADFLIDLERAFPNALCTRRADSTVLTGETIDLATVREWLFKFGAVDAKLELIEPSLTDAMNYHLRKIAACENKTAV